ncbi:UDP-glucose dehydrogenase family protein [Legionella oakridgensis]|uniref:UDP-glucose dehydrogenase family protein n=1 Tax=Legionella oakridgensis TaxID=29423 RepID=UPI0003DE19A0|nr:UDP-glucose/GDP-mannose dehydrogenase family protein [Legionella oakridgensis]ETO93571.1 nucleotide sugar dehydrogenase [Legionella oakridgensis RV-2-2007]
MIISVYGAGYVGLVSAACFAKLGHEVICADISEYRIAELKAGNCPIYEIQLPELLSEQQQAGRLRFTSNLKDAVQQGHVHIVATGTPSLPDGSADLSQVFEVVTLLARETNKDTLLVTKSTVPVGTGDKIEARLRDELSKAQKSYSIAVASNPEFLREGTAVHDFLQAERIVIGGNASALLLLKQLYQPLVEQGIPLVCMSRQSAELTKYAANAMLACRISFINQVSRIAEKVGADIDEIREGIGLDHRIGPYFLQAGIGYGGSCFPKDVRALMQTAKSLNVDDSLFTAIDTINQQQKHWVIEQLNHHFQHELQGRTISIWGLAFKPGTDDIREASSLVIMNALLQAGARLRVYDPVAIPSVRPFFLDNQTITWCDSIEETLIKTVDALVIATEWQIFREYPLIKLAAILKDAPIIDGRNCFELSQVEAAKMAYYYSVGRPLMMSGKEGKGIHDAG